MPPTTDLGPMTADDHGLPTVFGRGLVGELAIIAHRPTSS